MKPLTDHRHHLALIAVAIVAAAVFGWGAGAVVAVAVLGCVAMFGVLLWLISSETRRGSEDRDHQHQ